MGVVSAACPLKVVRIKEIVVTPVSQSHFIGPSPLYHRAGRSLVPQRLLNYEELWLAMRAS
jgi:hypothetical protein